MAVMTHILLSCGNRTIDNPSCEKSDALRITRIETTDTATVVSAAVIGYRGMTFSIDSDSLWLEGNDIGMRYLLRGTEGVELDRDYILDNTCVMFFKLIFHPVERRAHSLDLVTGTDDRFNVYGISLTVPDSVKSLPVCHVSGELNDNPNVRLLMLMRWLDYDTNLRGMKTTARPIEVKDGRFGFDMPVEAKDDYYILVPWNEYMSGSFCTTEFFAEEGDVRIVWNYGRPVTTYGGEFNTKAISLKYDNNKIDEKYSPILDSFYQSQTDLSAEAMAILEKARTEKDRSKQRDLYDRFLYMPDEERYSKEFYKVFSRMNDEYKRVSDSLYGVISADVSLGYMPKLFRDVALSADKRLDEKVARMYADTFADYGLGRRLGEYLDAIRTEVGGEYVDFEAPDRAGEMHRFSEMIAGSKIVLLDLWASWCSSCRIMAKANKPIYDRYRDKGLAVVSVAREFDNTDALDAAVAKDGYTWPVLVELDDRIGLWRQYNVGDGGGALIIIDPATGKIISRMPSTEEVERIVKEYCE